MKNLLAIKIFVFNLILITILFPKNLISSENKIIFKISEKAFTSLDLEKRLHYLDFVGNNTDLAEQFILDDFISANIFYEYYNKLNNKENYDEKIEEIYSNILSINDENNKTYSYKLNKADIVRNLKIDFIRKTILERLINININQMNISNEEIDLLYKFTLSYINLETENIKIIKNKITNYKNIKLDNIRSILDQNNINYFYKEKEIINVNNVDKKIRKLISSNKKILMVENGKKLNIIFINKKFETLEGIILNLYSIRSKDNINKNILNCKNLINDKNNEKIKNKEYKLTDLNNEIKNNLVNINDYIKFNDLNENVYVVLCNIKFDKEVLNNINFNKLINLNVTNIEKKFISKYSKVYNLIK